MKFNKFGYGMSADLDLSTYGVRSLPAAVHEFRKKLFRAYKVLIGFAVVLALLLPSDARDAHAIVGAWVDLVQQIIPYVRWVEQNSEIPKLAAVWFAAMWPLTFVLLLYVVVQFPYRSAHSMFRANSLSTWKWVTLVSGLGLVSWMAYWLFIERRAAVVKSVTHGHARLIEATAIDYRLGLAILGPLLISLCLVIWGFTLIALLVQIGRFFCADDEIKPKGELK